MASFLNVAYATLMDGSIRDLYAQDVRTVSLAQARHFSAAQLACADCCDGIPASCAAGEALPQRRWKL